MTSPESSIDRRPILAMCLRARARRSEKLWRKILHYYLRHAERVWRREDLRRAVREALESARYEVTALLTQVAEASIDYDDQPVLVCLELGAQFPEVVEYFELFQIADRIFVTSERRQPTTSLTKADLRQIQSQVSQALRNPAQVVADTPGLHGRHLDRSANSGQPLRPG